jgi:hypothetical protein
LFQPDAEQNDATVNSKLQFVKPSPGIPAGFIKLMAKLTLTSLASLNCSDFELLIKLLQVS